MMFEVVEEDDYVEVIKRAKCKTSPNGNYNLYNMFAGKEYHYEWMRKKHPYYYRVYRVYNPEDETQNKYVDISMEVFRIYFNKVN